MKFTCILLSFLFIATCTSAQVQLLNLKPLKVYEQYRAPIIKAFEKNNERYRGSISVDGVPAQFFDTVQKFSIEPVFKLQIEFSVNDKSLVGTATCKDPEFLIIVPDNGAEVSYEFDLKNSSIALLGSNRSIRYCMAVKNKASSEISFFYLFDKDKYLGNDAVVYSERSIIYLNQSNGNRSTNITDFLTNKYGSIDNFRSLVGQEEENNSLSSEAFKNFDVRRDAETFVKNSFKYHYMFLPADTVNNISYLINDISKSAGLKARQSDLMRTGIKNLLLTSPNPNSSVDSLKKYPERLKSYIADLKKQPEIQFMGRNISNILSTVLTTVQFKAFQHHLKVEELQFHRVDQYIYHDFLDHKYPDIKTKSDAYKNYIISLLKNSI